MRLLSIASGSSGNCIYVGSDTTHILLDVGISCKRISEGLNTADLCLEDLDGIFITHEHSDHIQGLGVLLRKKQIPVYATQKTIDSILKMPSLGNVDRDLFVPICPDEKYFVKDLVIHPMHISHDAADPVAYRVYNEGKKVGVITDLGMYDEYTVGSLLGMDVLLAEANHDVRMLEVGPYPYALKQRILGNRGHLSNENCGRLISSLLHDGTKQLILGHLSKENNMPELAYETVRLEITASQTPYNGSDFPILVARRDRPLDVVEI